MFFSVVLRCMSSVMFSLLFGCSACGESVCVEVCVAKWVVEGVDGGVLVWLSGGLGGAIRDDWWLSVFERSGWVCRVLVR
jgi:hypothetical protein